MDGSDPRSLLELISSLTRELPSLVRKESELVRVEVSEKLAQAAKAAIGLGLGTALLLGSFLVLLQALVLALSKVMDPLWASILVGVVVGGVGFMIVKGAANKLKPAELAPSRSVHQLKKDAALVKEQVK